VWHQQPTAVGACQPQKRNIRSYPIFEMLDALLSVLDLLSALKILEVLWC